jgi:histidinol-phosphate aminotransferase
MKKNVVSVVPGIRQAVQNATPYQPGQFAEDIQNTYNLKKVIKIASNENPYGPFPNSIACMQKEVLQLNLYPDANFTGLRAVLGRLHGISPDCISISHGAEGMLQTIAKCFLQKGDEVIIPAATYTLYREISNIMGATVISVPMDDYRVDPVAMVAALTPRTKLIWLANPNNPTGTIVDKAQFRNLLEALPETAWIVLDEAYAEFADVHRLPDRIALIREGFPVISVRTFSKAYGLAGARLGYAIAREEIVSVINTVSEPFNANRVALAGALGVLNEDHVSVAESLFRIKEERTHTEGLLRDLGLMVIPSQANFIMFETPVDGKLIYEELLRQGIIVRPCMAWGYRRMLRVTVGTPHQMEQFVHSLAVILSRY